MKYPLEISLVCIVMLVQDPGAGALLMPITMVFPSVVVLSVVESPVDKLEELVPVGSAPTVELAPAMILLASAGEIVEVEDGEGSEPEVGVD